ncbi:MAG: nucleotidyl transferase AbiEii/AbiGii toxin family protein [Longimicrobiaceae bacterium]
MTFHREVMPASQQRMLRRLGPITTGAGFFLAGGTAVAIQLGHRRSLDFDWFTGGKIADALGLAADLRRAGVDIAVMDVAKGTLHGEAGGVKLSFLEHRYPELVPPVSWPEYGCLLAGLEDLACMKLSALASRGAKKDFIDLYALGRERFSLDEMLGLYQRKFATQDLGHTLMSLTFFDDAEEEEAPEMLWKVAWEEVKRTVELWVSDYVRR